MKTNYFAGATQLGCEKIGKISRHQDGAIYGDYLFHLSTNGLCEVYSLPGVTRISSFVLDKTDKAVPHSNAVCFGSEFYAECDEFPLLYTNIYNNYSSCEDKREGCSLVYRIIRQGSVFTSKLVQIIKIAFAKDEGLWYSEGKKDVRPYGNFVVDTDSNMLYAFVMRDAEQRTRFFSFELPKVADGDYDADTDARAVSLNANDIKAIFDCPYMKYMQGATYYCGYIYSLEGILCDAGLPLKFRVIDLKNQKEIFEYGLEKIGLVGEPEFVAVYNGEFLYADAEGNLYKFIFS